jgi:CRP/FNR family cyclic AMP-dependent transcriptional regulator
MSEFFEYSRAGASVADTPASAPVRAGFLSGHDEREWRVLREYSTVEIVHRGESLITAGERDRSILIVLSGVLQAVVARSRAAESGDTTGGLLRAGDVFGEVAFFDGLPRSSTVVAVEDARVMRIRFEAVEPLSAREPALARALLMDLGRALAGRLRAVETRDGR